MEKTRFSSRFSTILKFLLEYVIVDLESRRTLQSIVLGLVINRHRADVLALSIICTVGCTDGIFCEFPEENKKIFWWGHPNVRQIQPLIKDCQLSRNHVTRRVHDKIFLFLCFELKYINKWTWCIWSHPNKKG